LSPLVFRCSLQTSTTSTALSPLFVVDGVVAAGLVASHHLFGLVIIIISLALCAFYQLTNFFWFSRSKHRGKKRSPRNQDRECRRSSLRMQKHIRKKTLERMGLTEADHSVKFSHKQDAPSLPPSPGSKAKPNLNLKDFARTSRAAAALSGSGVELPAPSAETVARIYRAVPSKRARRILRTCYESSTQ
jgi:hypothetical protein